MSILQNLLSKDVVEGLTRLEAKPTALVSLKTTSEFNNSVCIQATLRFVACNLLIYYHFSTWTWWLLADNLHSCCLPLFCALTSLFPGRLRGRKIRPGTDCMRMRKIIRLFHGNPRTLTSNLRWRKQILQISARWACLYTAPWTPAASA